MNSVVIYGSRHGNTQKVAEAIGDALRTRGAVQLFSTRSELGEGARVLRTVHALIAMVGLSSLAYLWVCALTRRRDPILGAALLALSAQGIAIVIGRGNCPLGPLQQRLGDPTPLFELILPPRAAKAAFPVLMAVTLGGLIVLAARPPSRPQP